MITYLRQDWVRLLGVLVSMAIVLLTAQIALTEDPSGLRNVSWILATIIVIFILNSAFLKGRAFAGTEKYLLANLWKKNLVNSKSAAVALTLLLLMQIQFLSSCFLILVWVSCLFFQFEFHVNEDISTFFDALYVILISATTIGFGDIPPMSNAGKVLALLSSFVGMIILGLVSASAWYSIQATFVVFRRSDDS